MTVNLLMTVSLTFMMVSLMLMTVHLNFMTVNLSFICHACQYDMLSEKRMGNKPDVHVHQKLSQEENIIYLGFPGLRRRKATCRHYVNDNTGW
jgi:hypothetical protein